MIAFTFKGFLTRVLVFLSGLKWADFLRFIEIVKDASALFTKPRGATAEDDARINAERRAQAIRTAKAIFPLVSESTIEWCILTALRVIKTKAIK